MLIVPLQMKGENIKIIRLLSILLCFVLIFHLSSLPPVQAVSNNSPPVGSIACNDLRGICVYECDTYRYCAVLDVSSSTGCFSIVYSENPDYAFEYYFSIENEELDLNSSILWQGIVSDCLANSSKWSSVHIPTVATVSNSSPTRAAQSSDAIRDQYVELLEEEL